MLIPIEETTRTLRALADETRLRMLALLEQGELSVSELQEALNMGQSRVSTQLTQLREAGLVQDRRSGRRSFYQLTNGRSSELLDGVLAPTGTRKISNGTKRVSRPFLPEGEKSPAPISTGSQPPSENRFYPDAPGKV